MASKIRLLVDHPLAEGQTVPLAQPQAHYLFGVMRLTEGSVISVFNGRDGEWDAEVAQAGKRAGALRVRSMTRPLQLPPDLWLLFAPIKKARTDFIVEKATEMGAARILPVQTDHTNAERVRADRLRAHAVEAAEQCGGTYVPEVAELARLGRLLDDWPEGRKLMFCDETLVETGAEPGAGPGGVPALHDLPRGEPWAILIGPEGGFSDAERARLRRLPFAHPVGLGPRILRADTAAVAALTLWQSTLGDWRQAGEGQTGVGESDTGQAGVGQAHVGRAHVGQADTGRADTAQADTGQADAGPSGHARAGTGQADTAQADAGPSGHARAGTGQAETARADTGQADAGRSGQGQAGTAQADAGRAGPGRAGGKQAGDGPADD